MWFFENMFFIFKNTYYLLFSLLLLLAFTSQVNFCNSCFVTIEKACMYFSIHSFTFMCFYVLKLEKKFACLFKYNTCFRALKWQMGRFCQTNYYALWCKILQEVTKCKYEQGVFFNFARKCMKVISREKSFSLIISHVLP